MEKIALQPALGYSQSLPLYRSRGYTRSEKAIVTRQVPEIAATISLRYFCIATDFNIAYRWMQHSFTDMLPAQATQNREQLKHGCRLTVESCIAQPFLMLVNDRPVCMLDLYQAWQHEIILHCTVKPGNYLVRLLLDPRYAFSDELLTAVFSVFFDYVASFTDVNRLLAEIEMDNIPLCQPALTANGFEFLQEVNDSLLFEQVL